jgi:uncharacterized phage protein (TIGR01671 family)
MNREIKFRAFDKNKRKMFYQEETLTGANGFIEYVVIYTGYESSDEWKDIELMQYTGLHDKHGKEIYEKDLVRCGGRCMDERKYKESRIGMMDWSDMHRGYVLFLRNKGSWCYPNSISYVPDTLEVIGNIWENPDLINEV